MFNPTRNPPRNTIAYTHTKTIPPFDFEAEAIVL
jgi:hypothetical protein